MTAPPHPVDRTPSGRSRRARADWLYPAGALVVVLVAWDLATRVFDIKPFILPPPLAVLDALRDDFPALVANGWTTLVEVIAGFTLSVAVGVPLAVAIASWPLVGKAVYPLLVGSQVVPKIAIAPLFVIWFGFGTTPKIIVAFLIAFFPIVIDTVIGLRAIEVERLYLLRSMGATRRQTFFKLRLPNALPYLFAGMKLAVTFAVTGAVVGEFIGADRGLGRMIVVANANLDTAALFAAVAILAAMGIVLFGAVDLVERAVVRWHPAHRAAHHESL